MRVTKVTCDRCGAPATGWARIRLGGWMDEGKTSQLAPHDMLDMDLCDRCTEALRAWAKKGGDGPWASGT